ncbi:hypothetical protein BDK88_4209 [Natrinema hispanicum]|uniref:Uncharacterized protein n=1 Tax=Natrinema hispanicum TaxID=392421 RepID=A0A482Y7T5_9EURY|nr:hypothetical protein [Natrinema hispanicum]RZV05188.1 hypothetical protein BDK88_4209 [Natrinema hispanicum]
MTPHDGPYFIDNSVYTDSFDPDAYYETLDRALTEMPTSPDFFVLPDVYGDAEATIDAHREWLTDRKLPIGSGEVMCYWVVQPDLPLGSSSMRFGAVKVCSSAARSDGSAPTAIESLSSQRTTTTQR